MKRQIWIEIISSLFIILFIYAGSNKLLDVQKFRVQISQSPLLTDMASLIAWVIPLVEFVTVVLLVRSRSRLIGLYLSLALMVMFTAYIIAILNFSEHIPCSCGGILDQLGWTEHLFFNLCFVFLAILGIIFYPTTESNDVSVVDIA